tara:strand:- start:43 stop:249 length:207 start_codon:yes stop_codon:yes gene_type:complete
MKTEQIEKLEAYFTDRFKTLLDGKMLNLQIESHKDANAIKQEYLCDGKIGEGDDYEWLSLLNLNLIGK